MAVWLGTVVRCDDFISVLSPYLASVVVDGVWLEHGVLGIEARTVERATSCPCCTPASSRVHSVYERRLADSSVGGRQVLITLTVRRLFFDNASCPRLTFAERVDGVTYRYGRRTPALRRVLELVGVALAGRAGSRLSAGLNSPVSRSTLLRLVIALPDPEWSTPTVLGVDDFATRRSHEYGTVIIDCESGQPLDLLPGRDSAGLAMWLRNHPGVEVICRDRAGAYADAARTGAPSAVQVADPFHLLQNLSTAVEHCVRHHSTCLKTADAISGADNDSVEATPTSDPMSPIEARIRERHAVVHALLAHGHGIREIARQLRCTQRTVQRTARTDSPEQLLTGRHQPRPSRLDPYKALLDRRWSEGHTNAVQLHAEICELGYTGSYQMVSDYLRPRRRQRIRTVPPAPPTVREITGWIMRHPLSLTNAEHGQLTAVLAQCPELEAARRLVRTFAEILADRSGHHLKDWIAAVRTKNLPSLHRYAAGLEKDWDAVVQGLTTHWNSGLSKGGSTTSK